MYTLYGDGVHDDTRAIQELIDSGISLVELPVPQKHYCISAPLVLHSCQTLKLGETTRIQLLPESSCYMLTCEENASDIVVEGGIWDYNNLHQRGNPVKSGERWRGQATHRDGRAETIVTYTENYRGTALHFYKATRLSVRNLTVKDPVTYCVELGYVQYFTVENVRFDQNLGNPTAENMDGIHIDGGCRFGSIRNVQGTCYDDIVALNADDGCDGTIEDISIDGVYGNDSLRGVRLLSTKSKVARITISNVFGTFYQNAVGLTYFFPRTGLRGQMSHISIRNIYGSNAPRIPEYNKGDNSNYPFAFVWIDGDLDIDFLSIDNLCRDEQLGVVETIKVCAKAHIGALSLSNILQQNHTGQRITLFKNLGQIDRLYLWNVNAGEDTLLENLGQIGTICDSCV